MKKLLLLVALSVAGCATSGQPSAKTAQLVVVAASDDHILTLPGDCCEAKPIGASFELQFDERGNIINLPDGVTEKQLIYNLIGSKKYQ